MTIRRLVVPLLILALVFIPVTSAWAAPVATDTVELSEADPTLDGAMVRFSGEAIGESLRADGDTRWVNVLNDGVAIGVVMTPDQVALIDGYGDWSRTGARIEVTGVFHVACEEHGGDLDVHATEVRVVDESQPRHHPVSPVKVGAALVALGLAAALVARVLTIRRRTVA